MFCSPSVWEEPFGLVNVEAFASGSAGREYIRWQLGRDICSWRGHSRRARIRRPAWHPPCGFWRRTLNCGCVLANKAMPHFLNALHGQMCEPRWSISRKRSRLRWTTRASLLNRRRLLQGAASLAALSSLPGCGYHSNYDYHAAFRQSSSVALRTCRPGFPHGDDDRHRSYSITLYGSELREAGDELWLLPRFEPQPDCAFSPSRRRGVAPWRRLRRSASVDPECQRYPPADFTYQR